MAFTQLVLNLIALTTTEVLLRRHVHEIAHVLDRELLVVLALGAALTGILLAWRSTWGLLQHWWIVVKLVLTVVLIIGTSVWLSAWTGQAVSAAAPDSDPTCAALIAELITGSVTVVGTLLVLVVVSVVKLWRTPHGRRLVDARRPRRQSSATAATQSPAPVACPPVACPPTGGRPTGRVGSGPWPGRMPSRSRAR